MGIGTTDQSMRDQVPWRVRGTTYLDNYLFTLLIYKHLDIRFSNFFLSDCIIAAGTPLWYSCDLGRLSSSEGLPSLKI